MASKVYRRAGDILDSAVGSDFVALNVGRGKVFGMEEVSAEVWRQLTAPLTLDQLCARLEEKYEVDEGTCRSDVADLLREMTDAGLVATSGNFSVRSGR